MAEFLTTNGTSYQIENVIIEAKTKLVLVSPYLQLSKTFYERLKDASNKRIPIKIIYGKDELKPNERNSLADLKGVELYFFENLHAKCYFNETKMVITSMNMYEFSEKNNREMGVLIEKSKDSDIYEKAVAETQSIIQSAEQIALNKANRTLNNDKKQYGNNHNRNEKTARGYCIRCQKRIDLDPSRPLCGDCFSTWVQFENYDFPENVCHHCGEYEETSMRKPLCYDCFQLFK
jgi:phosphatidylserine/phosphatidylglycerophosphate/cardiolipin synthase-like enzyme